MILQDRVALVTGAGRAIGRAIALRLARDGADVVLAGIIEEELKSVAAEVGQLGRRALVVPADVTHEDQVRAMADRARQALGRIDILVNNAGIIGPTAPVVQVERAAWDEVLAVNLTGAFLCCKAVVPEMIARRSGKVINIASVAGKIAYALRSPYAVSKWGLIGLTLTLAKEVGEYNIQVNAVCPGPVAGARMRRVMEQRARELGQPVEEVERTYVQTTVLKRMVTEDDVAALVAFLASPQADNITGQAIDVSAGYAL
ncbi:MAG TPA: SDR family NAD(P)-dependent oxidoreductase [Gemmataceae bacterium]|nr:SDR family NAD(P)-dependent oxidoreductase [Gemmataceae bacterium]